MIIKRLFHVYIVVIVSMITCSTINAQPKWVKVKNQNCEYYEPYYVEGFEAHWDGGNNNGKANGDGVLEKFVKGRKYGIYQGPIVNGQVNGMATYTYFGDDGTKKVYNCIFENGEAIGKGTIKFFAPNGQITSYEGEIVNYYSHGFGQAKYPDGSSFEGLFRMNQPFTGQFKVINSKAFWIYQGSRVDKLPKSYKPNYSPQIGTQLTEYFDEEWKRCNLSNAKFYRIVTYKAPNRPQGKIRDYYISGRLQSEFDCVYINYDDDNLNFNSGETIWYYENGQISRRCNFKNNIIIGKDINYFDNGKTNIIIEYDNEGRILSHKRWYKSGKPNIVADYKDGRLINDRYTEFDEDGLACQVMDENFNLNKQTWESKDDNAKSEVSSNRLFISDEGGNTTIRTNYIEINQNEDFSVEGIVDLLDEKNNNVGYGLVLGFKDWSNHCFFIISGDGQYKIQNTFEGINIVIKDWSTSSAINRGKARNLLKVMKIGDKMMFSINGTLVENIEAIRFRGGYTGMLVGGKGNFCLENLLYKEYFSSQAANSSNQQTPSEKSTKEEQWDGNGTGFLIDSRGYFATNHHVINGAKKIQINIIRDGLLCKYNAEVVQADPQNDLAIIRINDPKFTSFNKIAYNFNTSVKDVGTSVFALGYPMASIMGQEVKFTDGKISARTGIQGDATVYQISVPIQPGNSGGPLFDYDGNLVGITSSGLNRALQTENVNYAIKSSYLNALIDVLPIRLNIPNDITIKNKSLTEKIKILDDYVALILIKE
ncbi:Trypsin-like peptidase domain-containing protein [Prevotella sp. ne3005]|uniref:trypsin-like peptidase domain-containing protein n=1 Tax=Prevotella sp. ne3005 TaxID=1761887 RepID=UPI0008AB4AFA|nr:trypsin-like peptidase domain-containing protein [Prevotella sp. ne3005]SEM83514.1 Trypsin-like peptidase domain-containing protein [Prevotella sp. ne3005]